jgi:hypothetical protein
LTHHIITDMEWEIGRAARPHKLKCDHHKISNRHSDNRNHLQHLLAKSNRTNTFPSKITRLLTTFIAIVSSTSAPSASALLFLPLLLASNPWGVIERHAGGASSQSKAIDVPPPRISCVVDGSMASADFSHDDDLMRYKHELLSDIYEKSLNRGFVGGNPK